MKFSLTSVTEYHVYITNSMQLPYVYVTPVLNKYTWISFKSTHHSWRYERNYEWVFFSEHGVESFWRLLSAHWLTSTPHWNGLNARAYLRTKVEMNFNTFCHIFRQYLIPVQHI